jgi:hypothetical protein
VLGLQLCPNIPSYIYSFIVENEAVISKHKIFPQGKNLWHKEKRDTGSREKNAVVEASACANACVHVCA